MKNFGVEINTVRKVELQSFGGNLTFILDTGYNDHIINYEKYFFEFTTLEKPVCVTGSDNRVLKATKIGTIKVKFFTNNKKA